MCKSMFRSEVIRRVELCFFGPCVKPTSLHDRKHSKMTSDVRDPPGGYPCWQIVLASENANFYLLYINLVWCLILLLSRLLQSGSEPGLSLWEWARASLWPARTWVSPTSLLWLFNKYTYMPLWSPEVTWVNFHLTTFTIHLENLRKITCQSVFSKFLWPL